MTSPSGRRARRAVALVAVLALHALIVSGLTDVVVRMRGVAPAERLQVRLIAAPEPRPVESVPVRTPDASPAARSPAAPRAPAPVARPAVQPPLSPGVEPSVGTPLLASEAAASSASAADSNAPLLDSEASRRAIAAAARAPGVATRVNDQVAVRALSAQQQLSVGVREAGKGDCAKGEYAGAGMGLLSLPFLVAAVAAGDCAQ